MTGLTEYFIVALTWSVRIAQCEVYTSIAEMKDVILLETGLIDELEKYVELEMERLDLLQSCVDNYKQKNENALKDVEVYVTNPINAYLLIKRLTVDWKEVEFLIRLNNSDKIDIASYKDHPKFPTAEDLNGTIVALARLQDTYNLDTVLVARGELNGMKYSSELSASDCFEIGKRCYENYDFNCSYSWLVEADDRFVLTEKNPKIGVTRGVILEYMALSLHKLGNVVLALSITNKLLRMLPNHPEALQRKIEYENYIKGNDGRTVNGSSAKNKTDEQRLYQNLCQATITPPIEFYSKLKCRYLDNNNPFLLLAPFKMEELSAQPKIILFHDVLSDEEIDVLRELSLSRLHTSLVEGDISTRKMVSSPHRISKVAWLLANTDKHVDVINRRVSHMTGLSDKTAEPLQLSNYDVGGHFVWHHDFSVNISSFAKRTSGNRMATVLFYMSDVLQGGATVFSVPKLHIKPKKGTAVFWYNLHPNGEGDMATVHSACPVIIGSKWVAIKWLHEYGQEFLRPCEVNRFPSYMKS